jgi:hypothetical protein
MNGGTGELSEGERNGDAVARRRRGDGLIWWAQTQGCGERGKKGGGSGGDGAPFIGDAGGGWAVALVGAA